MTTLITGDLHETDNPRDAYRGVFLSCTLRDLIQKHNCSTLILLGDLTEAKDRHPACLVNRVVNGIANIARDGTRVIIVQGNHDYKEADNPFFRFLDNIDGVTYVYRPMKADRAYFLPHSYQAEEDWSRLAFEDRSPLVYCHQTFAGATGGFGRKMDGLELDLLPRSAKIISGDIHVPQKLKNLTYVGAPYRINFGDDYDPRVLLLNDGRFTSIPVPGSQKRVLGVSGHIISGEYEEGDIVRINVAIAREDYAKWGETRQAWRRWAAERGLTIESIMPIVADRKPERKKKVTRAAPATDAELLDSYGKAHDVDDRTLKVGKEML